MDVFDVACVVTHTLASSFEFMPRRELFEKIKSNLDAEMDACHWITLDDDDNDIGSVRKAGRRKKPAEADMLSREIVVVNTQVPASQSREIVTVNATKKVGRAKKPVDASGTPAPQSREIVVANTHASAPQSREIVVMNARAHVHVPQVSQEIVVADPLAKFITEHCRIVDKGLASTAAFMEVYNLWGAKNGVPRLSAMKLSEGMAKKGFAKQQLPPAPGMNKVNCFLGVELMIKPSDV